MSLTTFLKQPDVRVEFRQHFEVPKIKDKKTLLASPRSKRWALVGTAFDYLLRFYIQRLNKTAIDEPWVAKQGLEILKKECGLMPVIDNDKVHIVPNDDLVPRACIAFKTANKRYQQYLASGKLTDRLIESAFHLAQLDFVYRCGYIDENLGSVHKEDIEDLRNLLSLVKPEIFRANSLCLLNPTFGRASTLVGGADADLLIDDTLIDIKTVKDFKLKSDYYYQLLGYFILHRLSAIGNLRPKPKINKLGIYFSRYGHLEIFELRYIINPKSFSRFVKWFAERAAQVSHRAS